MARPRPPPTAAPINANGLANTKPAAAPIAAAPMVWLATRSDLVRSIPIESRNVAISASAIAALSLIWIACSR
ncbi:hypothetical protein [Nocardia abscessus]|uniref:hypothetical protein n=1 Tax=Nocardia abscessus TaxID=120957 RepID=UPI002455F1AA|nr:hypothetical protein [Nocardia abscessus]